MCATHACILASARSNRPHGRPSLQDGTLPYHLAAGEPTERAARPEDADLILFNTCSVREKAQEKVFSDLGRVKHLKQRKPGLVIGVGGYASGPAMVAAILKHVPPPALERALSTR